MNKTIGIIGCGWLGTALAKKLLSANHQVMATTASDHSSANLIAKGINCYQLSLPSNLLVREMAKHPVFTMSQLVICLPPRLKQGQNNYPEKIKQLVSAAEIAGVQQIILISSTAVYNGLSGSVDEQTLLDFTADKVQIIHEAEQHVINFSRHANVIRLAGLIGPDRHPGRFLSAKKLFPNPAGVVNMIHQQDAVGVIEAVLNIQHQPIPNKAIFNGVSDTHVTRKEFYQIAAQVLNLPKPQFISVKNSDKQGVSKEILGDKAKELLKVSFVYNDLISWLEL
ncbi:MAG: NAD(P)H-binding protein [Colwellia sp.]|nr:NAD(P)H-binding protein [Colwellia sp.]